MEMFINGFIIGMSIIILFIIVRLNQKINNINIKLDETFIDNLKSVCKRLDTIIVNQSNISGDVNLHGTQISSKIQTVNANVIGNTDRIEILDTKVNVVKNSKHSSDLELAKISSKVEYLYKQSQAKKKSNNKLKTANKANIQSKDKVSQIDKK